MPSNPVGRFWTPVNWTSEVTMQFDPVAVERSSTFAELAAALTSPITRTGRTSASIERYRAPNMEILVPFASFKESAYQLTKKDIVRLLIRVIRVLKTLKALRYSEIDVRRNRNYKWLKLWLGNEGALAAYGIHLLEAAGSSVPHLTGVLEFLNTEWDNANVRNNGNKKPDWLYNDAVIDSHRQALAMWQERDLLRSEFKKARKPHTRVRISGALREATNLQDFIRMALGTGNSLESLASGRVARLRQHLRECIVNGRSIVCTESNVYTANWGSTPSYNVQFPGE